MWDALNEIAQHYDFTLHALFYRIEKRRLDGDSLASATRVYIVEFYRNALARGPASGLGGARSIRA